MINLSKSFILKAFKFTLAYLVIIISIVAMLRPLTPHETEGYRVLLKPFYYPLTLFSFYQDWSMFSPNPSRTNLKVTARIMYADGTHKDFDYHMGGSLLNKYLRGERMRKLLTENIRLDKYKMFWPEVALYAAKHPENQKLHTKVLSVKLIRHWYDTPPPFEHYYAHQEGNYPYASFTFFEEKLDAL